MVRYSCTVAFFRTRGVHQLQMPHDWLVDGSNVRYVCFVVRVEVGVSSAIIVYGRLGQQPHQLQFDLFLAGAGVGARGDQSGRWEWGPGGTTWEVGGWGGGIGLWYIFL